MNDEPGADQSLTAAEQRLLALFVLFRSDLVRARPGLVQGIMQRVRWQQLVRELMRAIGNIGSAVGQGLRIALGRSVRGGARE
jgi:hypothetical protein